MNKKLHRAIAIDGPAASGKSTIAGMVADSLGLLFVNSGLMYRALTWEVLRRNISPANTSAIIEMLKSIDVKPFVENKEIRIIIDGTSQEPKSLSSPEINAQVSTIAAIPEARKLLVTIQQALVEFDDLVMDGRDIGSVVFPDSPYKIYLHAREEVRAARRAAQGHADDVVERDRSDSDRATSPLCIAKGATVIDTSELNLEQTFSSVIETLEKQGWKR